MVAAQRCLQRDDLATARQGLSALRRAKGLDEVSTPTMEELEPQSLAEGVTFVDETVAGWIAAGEDLLAVASVTFDEWLGVLDAVRRHGSLPISDTQADALVDAGFLRRVYAVPGGPA